LLNVLVNSEIICICIICIINYADPDRDFGERGDLEKFRKDFFGFTLVLALIQFTLLFTYNHVLFQNFENVEFKIAILLFLIN